MVRRELRVHVLLGIHPRGRTKARGDARRAHAVRHACDVYRVHDVRHAREANWSRASAAY